ncbi:MAG: response regulator transcription factor [Deltaproteobacteria bacterium]|nr:response regulator transcription factor [Deltaproteobacteria bacterium]
MGIRKKVLLIDDHPLFRTGVKSLLEANPSFEVVGEAGTGREGLQSARELRPELVILDISLPDQNGMEIARELRGLFPDIRILIVSMHAKIDYIAESFRAGALGYVIKESAADRLVQGLEAVSRGEYYLDSALSRKVVEKIMKFSTREAGMTDEKYATLTPREEQVLRLLAEGHTPKEIGEKLYISPKTVENHRANIMEKLNLHSTLELIRYAVRLGLVDPDLWKG